MIPARSTPKKADTMAWDIESDSTKRKTLKATAGLSAVPAAEFWRDPAMPYVESRRACDSRACYKPHSHPTFSIGAVDEGNSLFTGADGGPTLLRAGTVIFIPADRVHACNPEPEKAWSYQMLHLDMAWLSAIREEYVKEA